MFRNFSISLKLNLIQGIITILVIIAITILTINQLKSLLKEKGIADLQQTNHLVVQILDAYDNAKKQYISIWMDNVGTGISMMYGKSDDEGKTIFYEGLMFDPIQNKDVKVKSIVHYISENEILMEMYGYFNDVEFKSMEMKYTR